MLNISKGLNRSGCKISLGGNLEQNLKVFKEVKAERNGHSGFKFLQQVRPKFDNRLYWIIGLYRKYLRLYALYRKMPSGGSSFRIET